MDNPWFLLRQRKVEEGLKPLRQAYRDEASASSVMELGVAYLWVRQYGTAWEHYNSANEKHPYHNSSFYGMAGVAKWCLGESNAAVEQWVTGLRAEFTDAAGLGITQPLLLYVSSVLKPKSFNRDSARELLLEKSEDRRIKEWPGPIASWILGRINDDELRKSCRWDDDAETRDRLWLSEFYRAVVQYGDEHAQFKSAMKQITDTSQPEWSDENSFLARIWSEEFFIARNES